MKRGSHRAPDSLSEVRRKFERWRESRRRGTRIPEELWQAAAEVSREIGVSKTAQALGLDYYALRERAESWSEERSTTGETLQERGFLEIPLSACSMPECVFEVESAGGALLRVELRGVSPAHLETLARTLWSLAR
jgi:hypothetical protein